MQHSYDWFSTPVLGQLPPAALSDALAELGKNENEDEDGENIVLESTFAATPKRFSASGAKSVRDLSIPWASPSKLWLHTGHVFGYIPPTPPTASSTPISSLSAIPPDVSLKQHRITITLDRLCIKEYPGRGTHNVLLHFYAQNQVPDAVEDLHYNALYRVRQNEHAAIQGYPLFVGLSVGTVGIRLRGRTINVSNVQDEALLSFLESDLFKGGLHLATTAQPAIAPFSHMALGLAKAVAARHRNISVQDFDLGLDFSRIATGGRLAEGSYVAVQIPERDRLEWSWQEWMYHHDSGQIVATDHQVALPYNYLVFSISCYNETIRHYWEPIR